MFQIGFKSLFNLESIPSPNASDERRKKNARAREGALIRIIQNNQGRYNPGHPSAER